MTNATHTAPRSAFWHYWRGLSGWNFYFMVKFALLWTGYLNFHPLLNLIFLAFLLFPLPGPRLHAWRNLIAIIPGIALFWHDTWLPGPQSIFSEGSQLAGFSADYLLDLVSRFINWQMVGLFFVLLVAWLFIAQWLRVTVFVVAILAWLNISPLVGNITLVPHDEPAAAVTTAPGSAPAAAGDIPAQTGAPTSSGISAWLTRFYNAEAQRQTAFPTALPADAQPFDLLVINICSLSWDDIDAAGLMQHPLWSHFDIVFKHFNSATSYSGPAAIRLLRASCGQPSHTALYAPAGKQCYLFDNLAALGFKSQLMLDHNGVFGDFLKELRNDGGMQAPLMDQKGLKVDLQAFDNSPVYDNQAVLDRWLAGEGAASGARTATFFNLLSLHDGNHFPGQSKTADYRVRAQKLFDELDSFFSELQKSGRKVMVVIVPEHGAALRGDKMQVSGLRDIPSPSITNVPAAVKFFGMQAPHQGPAIEIDAPASYLAISELVARAVDGKMFTAPNVNWSAYTGGLPQTAPISENANAVVLQYQGKPYVRLNGGDWVPYPQ
ncbi:TPA: cellulose biosynthesis protein BcsG [Pluralibacter gergoviae]|uniref:cellulose biosynthesis protein BcsG n=1 Tax=Pluralibacter gergoviae TaxID=61647 RepID=UPI0006513D58|nr:cellulose biosynthesis protein BcsG [Pluralibacter gergoviae]KMK22446.1 membrane protein [Pluralibacter gergoviae]MBL3693167.1 cellulose biosynthesis protein BcsG [Pluralibacter gergoviae]HDS1151240.1 cellulose biosynthesis protein BcsG [Pluralibacter gergoviae]